ncbi:hypothetical protein JCM10207_009093 [Rhodosporidiobolus poonsookiae]
MSSSPKPPTDLTAGSAPPSLTAHDSAPPPTAPPAPVPPRTYSSAPLVIAAPPAYAPNSSVPTFLRFLAAAVLVGGTLSAAVAWVYKNILRPRLVVALQARKALFATHQSAYARLFDRLVGLVDSAGVRRLGGTEAVEFRRREREEKTRGEEGAAVGEAEPVTEGAEAKEKAPLLPAEQPAPDPAATAEEPPAPTPLPPPPALLEPLHSSLSSLLTAVQSASSPPPSSFSASSSNPSNLVQPTGMLLRSLVKFNETLDAETYAASTAHLSTYRGAYGASAMGGTQATGERRALVQVTADFKAEVRSFKGALLNRRNFSRPEATA